MQILAKTWSFTLASRTHRALFKFASNFSPIAWIGATMISFGVIGAYLVDGLRGAPFLQALAFVTLVPMPLFLWLAAGCWIIPDPRSPLIQCGLNPDRTLAAHLTGEIGNVVLLDAVDSVLDLACEIKARRIELYSPLFGQARSERTWLRWASRTIEARSPGAIVRVAHREPFGLYRSWRYKTTHGETRHIRFEGRRLQAACIEITNF